jgi:hypothetical protein
VRFHIAVDDGGEFLAVGGASLTLGHLRSSASLPFLADVEREHVRFTCNESFHSGVEWKIERLAARDARINGAPLGGEPHLLSDGDELALAPNLSLRFRQPDAASGSALLDLFAGAECQGARRVLLFARGSSGRVRIGSKSNRHVSVPDLAHEVEIEWLRGELRLSCAGGIRLAGAPLVAGDAQPMTSISIACPLQVACSVVMGARDRARPPFGIHLRPAEAPPASGAPRT